MADFVAPDYVPSDVLEHPVTEIPDIPGWKKAAAGKVREIFIPEDAAGISTADRLMLVATDRISAYDFILDTPIPGKGAVLTQLSRWWFNQLNGLVNTHYLGVDVPAEVAGRAMITRRLEMYPVECVARGYLTGSGLAEYQQSGAVCGIALPPGLREASKLSEPIFTPAIKAELGEHDENVSASRIAQLHGRAVAKNLTDLTLQIYRKAAEIAAERGIILADTKFEFGALPGHYVHGDTLDDAAASFVLGDEVITPDSSRFWPADAWVEGQVTPSFDKQYVRDWLTGPQSGWDRHGDAKPPALPPEVVQRTSERYLEAYRILTGQPLI
ncbi:phosphoribosylaminoimidazolesuccinocarboxamide synthase [uncultured Mobiluncus sp.]|uniref:phosphoribosylaminoimidazolesuccinocarboxamide synthase n=1 Tax=uncultured Mobiluncus sp. TaxID=293425 RepID=UPI002629BCB8|nr:phosphoribosylaminoimidazolesuccinocarboxamide synthase [uncultured Mobiluncus sp.]